MVAFLYQHLAQLGSLQCVQMRLLPGRHESQFCVAIFHAVSAMVLNRWLLRLYSRF